MNQLITVAKFFTFAIAVGLSLFQIYQATTLSIGVMMFRPIHLTWVLALIFMVKPLYQGNNNGLKIAGGLFDVALIVATIVSGYFIASFDYDDFTYMMEGLPPISLYSGIIFCCLLFEATRRSVGFIMVLIAWLFIGYALFGDLLPGSFSSAGFSVSSLVDSQVYSNDGVFGAPLGIAATVVFIYILFGAFLQVTGAGGFFIDCAFALAGKYKGGPAKASVIASAALGSISGSAIANTVTTGALTIPMMKQLGYKPTQAAGIEAAASTGGQIMPPIMGAGAFVMAEFTGFGYNTILLVSIAPAILYFLCTLLYVHIMATKLGLSGLDKVESIKKVFKEGWQFLLPLVFITTMLIIGFRPLLVGIFGCFAVVLVCLLKQSSRQTHIVMAVLAAIFIVTVPDSIGSFFRFDIKNNLLMYVYFCLLIMVAGFLHKNSMTQIRWMLEGLREGAVSALPISVACATAGIVVGVVGKTGIGLLFANYLLAMSGGYLWATLALIAVAAIILGMGLPVTAAYIVLAVVAVPVLVEQFGIHLLTAHLVIFWLSQTSNVTPPIALAAFAGAGIAKAPPMASAVQAFKLAQGFFIIPLMMIYSELLFLDTVTPWHFVIAIASTLFIIVCIAGAIEGYLLARLNYVLRGIFLLLALGILSHNEMIRYSALGLAIALTIFHVLQNRKNTPKQQTV